MPQSATEESPTIPDLGEHATPPLNSHSAQKAKVNVSYETQLNQIPGNGRSIPAAIPGVQPRHSSVVEFLSKLAGDADRAGWRVQVRRVGPAVWEGQQLPCGVIDTVEPMNFPEIQGRIEQLHGGGDYRLLVIDENGRGTGQQMPFRIDCMMQPPVIKAVDSFGSPLGSPQASRPYNPTSLNGFRSPTLANMPLSDEEQTTLRLKAEERKIAAERQVRAARRELEKQEEQEMEEKEARIERRERKETQPVKEITRQIEQMGSTFEKTMLAMQQATDKRFEQMMQTLVQQNTKPQDNSLAMIMIESMRSQAQTSMAMMQTMMQASSVGATAKASEQIEQAKLQAEQQKTFLDMVMRTSNGGNTKMDKLLEVVLMGKLNQNENQVETALKLMETGRRQALEMYEIMDERRGDGREEDPFSWEPDAGFGGNMAKMLFGLLKSVTSGKGGGAAQVILPLLTNMLQKPANTTQFTDSELLRVSQQLANTQPGARPALPPAQVQRQPAPALPQQHRIAQNAPAWPVSAPAPVASPKVPVAPPPASVLSAMEAVYETVDPVQQQPVIQAMPVQVQQPIQQQAISQPQQAQGELEVNTAFEYAIEDAQAVRRDPEWSEYASGKWSKALLDALYQASSDGERMEILRLRTDPALWNAWLVLVADETRPDSQKNYEYFTRALSGLISDHANEHNYAPPMFSAA